MIPHTELMWYETVELDYGWKGLLGVRFGNTAIAKRLIDMYQPGDVPIGHSNGGAIIAEAIDLGLPATAAVLIHPALRPEWTPPKGSPIKRIDVYYSKWDQVGYLATAFRRFAPLNLFFGPTYYGRMMTKGPTSGHQALVGINDGCGHSEGFMIDEVCKKYASSLQV